MEQELAAAAMMLSAGCLLIAALTRAKGDRQRRRVMLGSGAGLGGLTLMLLSISGT